MTYPRDFRDMSEPAIQNEIRDLNTGRLDDMLSAAEYGAPELAPASGVIEQELEERQYQEMALKRLFQLRQSVDWSGTESNPSE